VVEFAAGGNEAVERIQVGRRGFSVLTKRRSSKKRI
jgi:hypothetical protein